MKQIDWRVIITGIICITILETIALFMGYDGIILTTIISIIALAIGIVIPNPISSLNKSLKRKQ